MKTVIIPGTNRTRTINAIAVAAVTINQFKTNRQSAQLRQKFTDHYPGGRADNDLFGADEFGFADKDYGTDRVCFIDVPLANANGEPMTVEEVQARINALVAAGKFPTIQRTMSLKPILSEDQKAAIASGLTTVEKIAESQLAKKQLEELDENGKKKTEALNYNGLPFYRVHKFCPDYTEDVDMRAAEFAALNEAKVEHVAEAQVVTE